MISDWRFVRSLLSVVLVAVCYASAALAQSEPPFRISTVATDLRHPWGMAFINTESLLLTERPGRLWHLTLGPEGAETARTEITGLPEIATGGQGGLLDVILHPDFASNRWVYLSYSKPMPGGRTTAVMRGRLVEDRLTDVADIFVADQAVNRNRHHFGSRLVFDRDGYLFITVGDRGERPLAQDLTRHHGKLIRLHDDGRVPADNPFVERDDALPDIYSYGHRNPQGMDLDAKTGQLWLHEHGPRGGDEINRIRPGINYGWPTITYGREYSGGIITLQTEHPEMAQPHWYWVPSIAPSGLAIYRGALFPNWNGDFIVGALASRLLAVVELAPEAVPGKQQGTEARYLEDQDWRIRDVTQGPDDAIYLLTDSRNGQLVRLTPADGD